MTPKYWKSLKQRNEPESHRSDEFPAGASSPPPRAGRRDFLRMFGATAAAAAAVSSCERQSHLVPYREAPEGWVPGVSRYYATAALDSGCAVGLVVESRDGRPIKVEGNPMHPASLGGTNARDQALTSTLYDPDRARSMSHRGAPSSFESFARAFSLPSASKLIGDKGDGLAILVESFTSPTQSALLGEVRRRLPAARVFHFSPATPMARHEGSRIAFGRPLDEVLILPDADVILSMDCDFLGSGPFQRRYSRHFADRRRVRSGSLTMNRLYVAESAWTCTGMSADHRLRLRSSAIASCAAQLVSELLSQTESHAPVPGSVQQAISSRKGTAPNPAWWSAAARDLRRAGSRALVVCGERQPPEVHALVHMANELLGSRGSTFLMIPPVHDQGPSDGDLEAFTRALQDGSARAAILLGGNPIYHAAPGLDLAAALQKATESVYLGRYRDETSQHVDWFIPQTHELESWGDALAADGSYTLMQPLINPLYGGRTTIEVLAVLAGLRVTDPQTLVRQSFADRNKGAAWEKCLRDGALADSAIAAVDAAFDWSRLDTALQASAPPQPPAGLELSIHPHAVLESGSHANSAWLQELPDPVTKLTWENAALLSPDTARRLHVATGDEVELSLAGRTLRTPAVIVPGQADDSVAITTGHGRRGEESMAAGKGVNANLLKPSQGFHFGGGLQVRRTGNRRRLAITQDHWNLEGREPVQELRIVELAQGRSAKRSLPVLSMHAPLPKSGPQWGMVVDLTVCTGCSACVIACNAENNIAAVGREGVRLGREMQWLRIDRYYSGSPEAPSVVNQPMMCQHCEKAPCEYVCPVAATVHSSDGLNEMVYNRCVGTRFCSNNCPYKVRRFNYLEYRGGLADVQKMLTNPDVTVRERGVMEKCTYCVQRIRRAGIDARINGRELGPDEVVTACQQACPTGAIVFGPINDPKSEVARLRNQPQAYGVLEELGTVPRTTYLARVRNPNPEMPEVR